MARKSSTDGKHTNNALRGDADAPACEWPRMAFQEAMAMTPLRPVAGVKSLISQQPPWKPGAQLPWDRLLGEVGASVRMLETTAAYGGHVYAQAALAAARALEQEAGANAESERRLSIHTIHGVFAAPGLRDRPFVYQVTPLSSSRSFPACLMNARQPKQPSENPNGSFPTSDADLGLGNICFSCVTTFQKPQPTPDELQAPRSAQERYADILSAMPADSWEASPQLDLNAVKRLFPNQGRDAFPILDMYKVNMEAYNAGKPVAERRELILYRLLRPLPQDDVNAHLVCHAFEADRNGLLMLANYLGHDGNLARAGSLVYSFYVHVNGDEAVMDGDGWWLQEVSWPRVSAGRGMMESKLWSLEDKHIASGYQDGLIVPAKPDVPKL